MGSHSALECFARKSRPVAAARAAIEQEGMMAYSSKLSRCGVVWSAALMEGRRSYSAVLPVSLIMTTEEERSVGDTTRRGARVSVYRGRSRSAGGCEI